MPDNKNGKKAFKYSGLLVTHILPSYQYPEKSRPTKPYKWSYERNERNWYFLFFFLDFLGFQGKTFQTKSINVGQEVDLVFKSNGLIKGGYLVR